MRRTELHGLAAADPGSQGVQATVWLTGLPSKTAGVVFEGAPRHEPYGTVVVFQDLYGNRWDLIQPNQGSASEGSGD